MAGHSWLQHLKIIRHGSGSYCIGIFENHAKKDDAAGVGFLIGDKRET